MSFHSALFTSCCNLFDPNLLIKGNFCHSFNVWHHLIFLLTTNTVSISLINVDYIDFLVDILEVEKLPPSNKEIEDIVSYDWKIDTKYYTAEIKLCSTTKRTVGTEEFADGVQAVVIYFNADQVRN